MPKTSELNKALIELQEELTTLKSLSDYISDVKNSAADAIEGSAKTLADVKLLLEKFTQENQVIFGESSAKLKESSDELINKSSDAFSSAETLFNKNVNDLQENLSSFIQEQNNASKTIAKDAKNLSESSTKLVSSVDDLLKKIDGIDFPNRLDKLDTAVSSLNTGIQNIQGRLDKTETNINKNLDNKISLLEKDIVSSSDAKINNLQEKLEVNHKISILLLVIGFGAVLGYVYFVMSSLIPSVNSISEVLGS
jgi:chromosome segregation ATPase